MRHFQGRKRRGRDFKYQLIKLFLHKKEISGNEFGYIGHFLLTFFRTY